MNYLAHLFLSGDNKELMIGNFIADFIRGKQIEEYSEEIQRGIHLHRAIDKFTDSHAMVRQGVERLRATQQKYAPVVIDIFYDYLLANNWERYHEKNLEEFAIDSYATLETYLPIMPTKLQRQLPVMIEHNWLLGYRSIKGISYTFERMSKRTSFASNMLTASDDLLKDEQLLHEEFNQFFPEMLAFVEKKVLSI